MGFSLGKEDGSAVAQHSLARCAEGFLGVSDTVLSLDLELVCELGAGLGTHWPAAWKGSWGG